VADLGTDQVFHFELVASNNDSSKPQDQCVQAKREMECELLLRSKVKLADGSGPRHLWYHPNPALSVVYVSNELDNTVSVIQVDYATFLLKSVLQTVPGLPRDFKEESSHSHIMTDHAGRFLYVANRGHNTLTCFQIDSKTGKLSAPAWYSCGGSVPRHFNIDPSNRFMLVTNQEGQEPNVAVLQIDHDANGALKVVDRAPVGSPACVQFYEPDCAALGTRCSKL
jgi:6-phosphogluconolactonase